ncbi:MAG: hypothetical protein PUG22_06200 [Peptoniphilaceae bacterium]|nr:hypothetical protein [Peptoniphilaceae bacterium]
MKNTKLKLASILATVTVASSLTLTTVLADVKPAEDPASAPAATEGEAEKPAAPAATEGEAEKPAEEKTSTNLQIELNGENVFNEVFRGTKKEVSEEVQKAVLKYFNENKDKVELDGDPQSFAGVIVYKFKTKDTADKEQTEDEKYGVKPDDDKAIEDKIKDLTGTGKEDKEQTEDEKYGVKPDDDKAIEDKIKDLTGTGKEDKEQTEDEKYGVKPDDDKAIKDKIAELTGTKKEDKEEEKKEEKKDEKKATNNPKTGIVAATSVVGLGVAASAALASLKKRK